MLESRDNPSAPYAEAVVLDNVAPKTNDMLYAEVQNAVDWTVMRYVWKVDDVVVRDTTSTLTDAINLSVSGYGDCGEVIELTVTPMAWDSQSSSYIYSDPVSAEATVANTAPVFTPTADPVVNEDAGAQSFVGWAADILAEPVYSTSQVAAFVIEDNSNESLFSSGPQISAAGTLTFTPAANASGSAEITIYLQDDGGGADTSASVTFTITVNAVNDAPTPADDAYTTPHGQPLDVQASQGVLENDTDEEWDFLTAVLIASPLHGSVTLDADGALIYIADTGYVGFDSFTYKAHDGALFSETRTVSIEVTNAAPVTADDRYHVEIGYTLSIPAEWGVLANDTDADDVLTVMLATGPYAEVITLNEDGSFEFTPSATFPGEFSFGYIAIDATGAETSGTIYFTTDVAARDDAFQVHHGETLDQSADYGVLANDDIFDDDATVLLVNGPAYGELILNSDGSFTYISDASYIGTDQFTYQIDGGTSALSIATVSIDVINEAPIPESKTYTLTDYSPLFVSAYDGLLANAYDAESDALTATIVQWPTKGSLDINSNGSFTYTPEFTAEGIDFLIYKVTDSFGASSESMPLQFALAQAGLTTISGQITYDAAPNRKYVRYANIQLEALTTNPAAWVPIASTTTSTTGRYQFTVGAPSINVYTELRVSVFTSSSWKTGSPQFVTFKIGSNPVKKTSLGIALTYGSGHTLDFNVGATADRSQKAFWTFDALVTAPVGHTGVLNGEQVRTHATAEYTTNNSSYTPGGNINVSEGEFKDWDVIVHEYAHFVQYTHGFRFATPINEHELGTNVRVTNPFAGRRHSNTVAFKEGFADFFSIYAQQIDSTAPTVTFNDPDENPASSRDMLFWDVDVEDAADGMNAGEDEEVTVMRVLWDLYDNSDNLADSGHDYVTLSSQLFDLIRNRNLNTPGTVVAATLGNLWDNLYSVSGDEQRAKIGDLMQLNNVAPATFLPHTGSYVAATQVSNWTNANANSIPTFWFQVPQGVINEESVEYLLNSFSIRIFNDNYTQTILHLIITDSPNLAWWAGNSHIRGWTPAQAEWNAIKANNGTFHWIIAGGMLTENYLTGLYWGGANDITIDIQ